MNFPPAASDRKRKIPEAPKSGFSRLNKSIAFRLKVEESPMPATCRVPIWILAFSIFSGCVRATDNAVNAPDGVEVRFDQGGTGSPALVFVHGWGNDRSVWQAQFDHFSEKYRVVNIDLPGFGESGNNRQTFTLRAYGEDVATVITELDLEHVVLIGFSMGGPVVIETANLVPERIAGLVVTESLYDVERQTPVSAIADIVNFHMDIVTHPTNEKLVSNGFYKTHHESSFKRVSDMLQDAPGIGWKASLLDTIRWGNEDRIEAISHLQVPVIAINSDRYPTKTEVTRKYVPSFHARIIENTGHLVMWDAQAQFNRLLEESIQEITGKLEQPSHAPAMPDYWAHE